MADIKERGYWSRYQAVYQDIVRHTSTPVAPWYVVPADHKWFARVVIGSTIVAALESLNLQFPQRRQGLAEGVRGRAQGAGAGGQGEGQARQDVGLSVARRSPRSPLPEGVMRRRAASLRPRQRLLRRRTSLRIPSPASACRRNSPGRVRSRAAASRSAVARFSMPSAMTERPSCRLRLTVEPTIAASSGSLSRSSTKELVDLQPVERELLQIAEARIAGAEIVEHDADAELLDAAGRCRARLSRHAAGCPR